MCRYSVAPAASSLGKLPLEREGANPVFNNLPIVSSSCRGGGLLEGSCLSAMPLPCHPDPHPGRFYQRHINGGEREGRGSLPFGKAEHLIATLQITW